MILNVVTVVQFLYWIYSDALGGEIAIPCAQADADHGGFPQKGPAEMSSRLVLVDLWENYGHKAGKIVDSNQRILGYCGNSTTNPPFGDGFYMFLQPIYPGLPQYSVFR